ncbi:flagellar FlbD family protein [Dehalobacter sp. DCM]|uniref:flagellar FlbD family protein n=1 Tax=Dehalobacter sp. DCM TaxID=2907827 RepID=UPI003081528B|nr:flagellar FlbD family protein [Dehalobacter sp. DCM]
MIYLTRINGKVFTMNPDLIETAEATPDTIITLTNEKKYVVKESIEVIIERVAEFKRRCHPEFRGGPQVNED